jgi:hypothetical protein
MDFPPVSQSKCSGDSNEKINGAQAQEFSIWMIVVENAAARIENVSNDRTN